MLNFEKKQKIYNIGKLKIGGNLGENPTIMIGSIFYKGDKVVKDEKTGSFDRLEAEVQISKVEEISDRIGLPAMFDVVCANPDTTEEYLGFVADTTDMPFLIDAVSEKAALKGLDFINKIGATNRAILNSINPKTGSSIFRKIKEIGLKNAILLTYSTKAIISSKERVNIVENLLPKLEKYGVSNVLVDTVVLDIATLGLACKAIYDVKDKFGLPSGCGAHNSVSSWKALKRKKDKMLTYVCSAIANGLPIALGADFILYGPISDAEYLFPAIGLIDASYGQLLIESGKRPVLNHPRFKISRF
jgi:tetrahydromethanopterin S-methyltransferase subunit H